MSVFRAALLAAAASSLLSVAAFADGTDSAMPKHVRLDYDQTKVLRLDRAAKTVLVGNPSIADAMLIDEKTVYLQGRTFGNTNFVAVDANGAEILNAGVTVGAPNEAQVTLYRGALGQRNLACLPRCERTMTQGDREMPEITAHNDTKTESASKAAALASGK